MKLQSAMQRSLTTGFGWAVILLLMAPVLAAQEKIAFETQRDGNHEIYVMNADGTNQLRLTVNPAFDSEPAFSPGGEKIAFTTYRSGNGEIYIMDADGSSQTNLTNDPAHDILPTFSPDGSKIAFVSDRGGHLGIWVMNVDGSNQAELADGIGGTEPAFSPDGTKIVFTGLDGNDTEIFMMNADGTGRTNLTHDPDVWDSEPSFSPDGTRIVYVRDPKMGTQDIFSMDTGGANRVNLTNHPSEEYSPSFSPDGGRIAFATFRDSNVEIYAMNADGTNPVNLTNNPGQDHMPVWGAANSAPVLSNIVVSSPIDEGETAILTGEIIDANAHDSFTLTITWGDGQLETFDYPAGTTSFEETHTYTDDPPAGAPTEDYLIMLTVSDHRSGIDSDSIAVRVNNVDPILSGAAVAPSSVALGSPVMLSGNYTDHGYHGSPTDEQLRVFVDWGDGQSGFLVTTGAPGAILETHQYGAIGNYTINIQVTDNDGGLTVETLDVVVSPPPPPAAPTDFRVSFVGANQIQLAWTDASNNEDGFAIERCTKRGCSNFVEIGRVGPNTTAYLDSMLLNNTQYSYRMRAFNIGGVSDYTKVVSAKTLRK